MDSPAPRTRHLADRARLQSAGRRVAGRIRPAAIALICLAAACAKEPAKKNPAPAAPTEDFHKRFVEGDWDGVGEWKPEHLVRGLQAYIAGDGPMFPRTSRQVRALHGFLYRADPDPKGLYPLFGKHDRTEVDEYLQRRDLVAFGVVTSWLRRVYEGKPSQAHYDAIAYAGVHFAFDPAYGDAYTHTGSEVGDFYTDVDVRPNAATTAALQKHVKEYLQQWRRRVTDRATSTFFGLVLRHLGTEGAALLAAEWGGCNADERLDLISRYRHEDELPAAARRCVVAALFDDSDEVRGAAFSALEAHKAPLGGLDASAREVDIAKIRPGLERWAETES